MGVGMGGCCCEGACCPDRIFRGDSSNAVNSLTLSLVGYTSKVVRQYDSVEVSTYTQRFSQCAYSECETVVSSEQELADATHTLTYSNEVPDAAQPLNHLTGTYTVESNALHKASGWYVKSMNFQDLGVPVWVDAMIDIPDPLPGKLFIAKTSATSGCVWGFVADSPYALLLNEAGSEINDGFFYMWGRSCFNQIGRWYETTSSVSPGLNLGFFLGGITMSSCAPMLGAASGPDLINNPYTTGLPFTFTCPPGTPSEPGIVEFSKVESVNGNPVTHVFDRGIRISPAYYITGTVSE
jgi:hypothetical protein